AVPRRGDRTIRTRSHLRTPRILTGAGEAGRSRPRCGEHDAPQVRIDVRYVPARHDDVVGLGEGVCSVVVRGVVRAEWGEPDPVGTVRDIEHVGPIGRADR